MATVIERGDSADVLNWQNRQLPMKDTPELRAALDEGNVSTLLMVYIHLTHDEPMLDVFSNYIRPPYSSPGTAIPQEYLTELRSKLLAVLTVPGVARSDVPSDAMMQKMMSVGVGEPVADEFLPLMFDQMGLKPQASRRNAPGRVMPPAGYKVLVIGAGLTGLAASHKLEDAGYDHIVIEKNPEVGGTWYENRYPGVGVDTPSLFYSYSFEITPEWDHYHPHGADMQKYLLHVADKYDLRRHIRFDTVVTSLAYDDAAAMWDVTVRQNGKEETLRVNAVINAHGPVNRFKWPNIPGLEEFAGTRLHTASWDPSLDLKGKRVAVIGTGASSAQLIPAIVDEVAELTIFQRTKHWVIFNPEVMSEVTPGIKFALRHIPHYREWFRFRVYWFAADGLFPNVLKDPEWQDETGMSVSALNEGMRQFALAHINAKFADRPDLKEKVTPDFPIFSKRIVMDGGLFDAYKRDHVTLEQGKIERITPTGVRMADGTEYEVDVLVCATGFDVANMLGDLTITGKDGRNLRDEWGMDDPRAYLGVVIPGYPNYFLTVGPNSAPNHAAGQNLVSEVQINYIIEALDWANGASARGVEPRQEAFEAFNRKIDTRMQSMIWTHPKANSYYNNSKGRIFLSWPYRLIDYWNEMRGPKKEDFDLV